MEQITKADRNARHVFCSKGKSRATLRRLSSTVLYIKSLLKTPFTQITESILQADKRNGCCSLSLVGNGMVRNLVVWRSNIHLSAWQRLKQIAPNLISPKQIVPKRICQAVVFFPDCKVLVGYVNGGLQDYAWWDSEACR